MRVNVRSSSDTFPITDTAIRWAVGIVDIEAAGGALVGMIVAGHDHYRLLAVRETPEPWQGSAVGVQIQDQVCEQPLMFVRLRNPDLLKIYPVLLGATKEQVVGADRGDAVALLTGPRGIALS